MKTAKYYTGGGGADLSAIVAEQASLRQLIVSSGTVTGSTDDGSLRVEQYRADGDSDAQVWRKAIAAMQTLYLPLQATAGKEYNFTGETIVVGGNYWNVNGNGCRIYSDHGALFGRIGFDQYGNPTNADQDPDLSYPSLSNLPGSLGPLRGAAFVFTTEMQNRKTENLTFNNFRFAIAHLSQDNSPIYRNCDFSFCNIGVLCYQGMQCPQFVNIKYAATSCFFAAACVAYPSDSPYKGLDNYFVDKFSTRNIDGYPQTSRLLNPALDRWFVKSFIRPRAISNGQTYNLPDNQGGTLEIQENHEDIQVSGRAVFMPFRNYRPCFDFIVDNIDQRDNVGRIPYLVNTIVSGLQVARLAAEGFENAPTGMPFIKVGSVARGKCSVDWATLGVGNTHDKVGFSGRGVGDNGGGLVAGTDEFLNPRLDNDSLRALIDARLSASMT